MDVPSTLRSARLDAGLSLRDLAARASTSHSTLAAYESGSKSPTAKTLQRILHAAGYATDIVVHRRHRGTAELSRGDELAAVLDLAAAFPAAPEPTLTYPVFGRR